LCIGENQGNVLEFATSLIFPFHFNKHDHHYSSY